MKKCSLPLLALILLGMMTSHAAPIVPKGATKYKIQVWSENCKGGPCTNFAYVLSDDGSDIRICNVRFIQRDLPKIWNRRECVRQKITGNLPLPPLDFSVYGRSDDNSQANGFWSVSQVDGTVGYCVIGNTNEMYCTTLTNR